MCGDYKQDNTASWEEAEEQIIMKTKTKDKTKSEKRLYIRKESGKPEKMEILSTNKKAVINIIYNEVTVNS